MQPVEVPIRAEWRVQADEYARTAGFPTMRTGKLAEYAVIFYLRSQGVQVREDRTPMTQPDYFDLNLGSTLVDVKSCLAPSKELRVPRSHFDRGRRFAFYIGVQVSRSREVARIFGYCTKEDIRSAKARWVNHRAVYTLPFSRLRPISSLVSAYRRD